LRQLSGYRAFQGLGRGVGGFEFQSPVNTQSGGVGFIVAQIEARE
jgi:hypothetical protein